MKNGKFHLQLVEIFTPQVVRYVDLMEASIGQSIQKSFEHEASNQTVNITSAAGLTNMTSMSVGSLVTAAASSVVGNNNFNDNFPDGGSAFGLTSGGSNAQPFDVKTDDLLWKLEALQNFIKELHWPEEIFAEHLDNRLKMMAADMIEAAAQGSVSGTFNFGSPMSI